VQFPQELKRCVVFIAAKKADDTFAFMGTAFLVADDTKPKRVPLIITAKHVLNGIKDLGLDEVCLRVNLKDGSSHWYSSPINKWFIHPDDNVDVALWVTNGAPEWDHNFYPLSSSATQDRIKENEIDGGDDLFYIGLFSHHHGRDRNIPIVRVGNIAALPAEQIQTAKYKMDGYLVESRSIGGLSGSPVFVNLGNSRIINGELLINKGYKLGHLLLGLIHGHYDHKGEFEKLNTGIAIVVPVEKIFDTIEYAIKAKIITFTD
jgi:hypothetical protein